MEFNEVINKRRAGREFKEVVRMDSPIIKEIQVKSILSKLKSSMYSSNQIKLQWTFRCFPECPALLFL